VCHQTHRREPLLAASGAYPRTLANTDVLHRRLRDEALRYQGGLGDPSARPVAISWGIAWAPAPPPIGVALPEREKEVVAV
jgi:hypothetical protein